MSLKLIILTLAACSSYIIGSIPFGYILGRLKGVDVRKSGSGNIGATNVTRLLGFGPGILVLILDALKGVLGVFTVRGILDWPVPVSSIIGGLMVILGHNYSVFLGFRGGRGVATGLGVSLCLIPYWTLIGVAIFAIVVAITRYVSLGSIAGVFVVVILTVLGNEPLEYEIFVAAVAVLIIARHRSNIARLVAGKESKLQFRTKQTKKTTPSSLEPVVGKAKER